MNRLVCFFTFLASLTFAEEELRLRQATVNPRVRHTEESRVLIKGIILIPSGEDPSAASQKTGVKIDLGPGNYQELKKGLMPFLGIDLNDGSIEGIKKTVVNFFQVKKKELAIVLLPQQDVTDGIIVFEVLEAKTDQIRFIGQKWFSPAVLKRGFPVKEGEPVNQEELLNYVSWINRSPFHYTQMIFAPGSRKGMTDLEFVTVDRFPARFFIGMDNAGVQVNGETRVYGGASWGNAFQIGDVLSYQYLATPDFHRLQTHTVNYVSFLSCQHVLTMTGSYGQIYPNVVDFTSAGKTALAELRYQIPIKPLYGTLQMYWEGGFDYKYLNSNLFFESNPTELPTSTGSINVTEFYFAYGLKKIWERHALNFKIESYASVWKNWLPHQSTSSYDVLRPNSHVRYGYFLAAIGDEYTAEQGWGLKGLIRAQGATGPLPSSEQFTLGGADTVRGYNESQFIADNAIVGNFEFSTPKYSVIKRWKDSFYALAFIDCGYGRNYVPPTGSPASQTLIGIGPGVRYDIQQYASFQGDYGFELHHVVNGTRFGRFHLSGTVSY